MIAKDCPRLRERLERRAPSPRSLLAAILLLALALRGAVAFLAGFEWFTPDSRGYFEQADSILAGAPVAHFPNGFPLLVALAKLALPPAAVPAGLMALQVLLSTAVVALAFSMARALTRCAAAGLAAALLLAVYPNQLVYLHYLLSDVSACFLVTLGTHALVRQRFAAAGVLLASTALFRSTLAPVAPLACLLVGLCGDAPRARAALRLAAGASLVALLFLAGVAGGVVRPSANLGSNLLLAVSDTSSGFGWSKQGFGPAERAAPLATYLRFALEHPGAFWLQRASSLYELWGPYPLDAPRAVWENLLIGLRFPLLLAALFSLAARRRQWQAWAVALPPAVLTAVHTAFFSTPRFAFAVMPLVVVLAASALPACARAPAAEEATGRPAG